MEPKIMMKCILAILVCVLSIPTFANTIPQEKLEDYKQAVLILFKDNKYLNCEDKQAEYLLLSTIKNATYGEVHNLGQPIIKFGKYEDETTHNLVYVYVTNDLKSILNFNFEQSIYKKIYTNSGDLLNPIINVSHKWTPVMSGNCQFP